MKSSKWDVESLIVLSNLEFISIVEICYKKLKCFRSQIKLRDQDSVIAIWRYSPKAIVVIVFRLDGGS